MWKSLRSRTPFPLEHIVLTGEKSFVGNECEKTNHIAQLLFNIKETMRAECLINATDVNKTLVKGSD